MENNAVALVFINNHPKGNPHPSKDNKFIIKKLKEVAQSIYISVNNNLIIERNNIYFAW